MIPIITNHIPILRRNPLCFTSFGISQKNDNKNPAIATIIRADIISVNINFPFMLFDCRFIGVLKILRKLRHIPCRQTLN